MSSKSVDDIITMYELTRSELARDRVKYDIAKWNFQLQDALSNYNIPRALTALGIMVSIVNKWKSKGADYGSSVYAPPCQPSGDGEVGETVEPGGDGEEE